VVNGARPGAPPQPGAPLANGVVRPGAPQQTPQAGVPPQQSAQPGAPLPADVPQAPQRQDSGTADVLPVAPGQEAQVLPPGATPPATAQLPPGAPTAEAAPQVSQDARARRFPRQVPAGEQVLRALQNTP
jgi:hypothetical protein